jgi:two-component system sensor histidine kinase KdpD
MPPDEQRPDPEALLALARQEERRQKEGRLRVFLGAAPGVGKTYAMLEAARARQAEGVGLLVGVVETHGRPETQALLAGLEVLPRRQLDYNGHTLQELDLDAALVREPSLLLVDELAHTNVPGSRHPKRWQDVLELLERGIDVYTTLNVQHLESQSDVVAGVSGVAIRETVPDSLLERADAVVLVDLPPEDLLTRLKEGKVYLPRQAEWAAQHFFRPSNLAVLRELALRTAARRVNAEVLTWRSRQAVAATWPTSERLLVCVGPAPTSADLVRAAKRLADGLRAAWFAVYIETPALAALPAEERNRAVRNLQLAQRLGAETMTLTGHDVASEVIAFARARNANRIIIGKPLSRSLRERLMGSFVDRIIRDSGDIDVQIIRPRGAEAIPSRAPAPLPSPQPAAGPAWRGWAGALGLWTAATGLCFLIQPRLEQSNLIMIYLLGVTVTSVLWGRWPALANSVLSVAAFDFFFVPPFLTFAVSDTQYFVTFTVMLAVALVISTLATRLRERAEAARVLQRRSEIMHSLSAQLARQRGAHNLLAVAARQIGELFESEVTGLMPGEHGQLVPAAGQEWGSSPADAKERGVAQWAYDLGQSAGWGTENLPYCQALYVPLLGVEGPVGVLQVRPQHPESLFSPEQTRLLSSLAGQLALTLEVERLEQSALRSRLEGETERTRSSLLSAVTHDFQTPLAAVMGSASSIVEMGLDLPRPAMQELAENIYGEAERLSRLINNLLRVTRLQSGALALQRELQPLEEVIGAALNRLERAMAGRELSIDLPADLPLLKLDGPLMEQLFLNLLENALKYTPEGSPLSLRAWLRDNTMEVELADQGPGVAEEERERIFALFQRSDKDNTSPGHGLGLAICRAIVAAHGGRIWVENLPEGGAAFRVSLPLEQAPAPPPPKGA